MVLLRKHGMVIRQVHYMLTGFDPIYLTLSN